MAQTNKKANWCIIGYPDSLPENWIDILKDTYLPFSVSPLHDKDLKEDGSGDLKKPHYHIIVCWPGPTTPNNVKQLAEQLHASTWKAVESLRGAYRYHCHLDDPDKYQYDQSEIRNFSGFDPNSINSLTATELRALSRRCIEIINEQQLTEYADLVDLLLSLSVQDPDESGLFDYATHNTIMLNNYLASKRNKAKEAREKQEQQFTKRKMAGDGQKSPIQNQSEVDEGKESPSI